MTSQLNPAAPTMVTSMENTCNGSGGLLYWNPMTNAFKTFCVTGSSGGFQFAVDLNRSTNSAVGSDDWYRRFGGGDVWATVHSNADFAPYVNFRGSGTFTRWNVGADTATGIRVNPANGKVYFGNFGDGSPEPAEIIELDPRTNTVRKWPTGNRPYQLFFDGTFVWATAVASQTLPYDQILRLDPAATWGANLTRWNLPANSFQQTVVRGTNPNSITVDLDGKVWFTETAASKVGRLDPNANTITEYTKASVLHPQNISSSGSRHTLQAFFTEGTGNAVSVLTNSIAASPRGTASVPVLMVPSASRVYPATSTATPVTFTLTSSATTITPALCQVEGLDPSGILRFPAPFGLSQPAGITPVVMPQSVFGTLRNSSHVFQLSTPAIIATPPSVCSKDDDDDKDDNEVHRQYTTYDGHDDKQDGYGDDKHDGKDDDRKGHGKMRHKQCEVREKKRPEKDDDRHDDDDRGEEHHGTHHDGHDGDDRDDEHRGTDNGSYPWKR